MQMFRVVRQGEEGHEDKECPWLDDYVVITAQSPWLLLTMSLGYTFELYNPGEADP